MMKKVFLSLLMSVACLPALFAQSDAVAHVIKIDSITTCNDYVWERNGVTYTTDTVALYFSNDTTFILNYTKLTTFYDTLNVIEVSGECSASWGAKTWTESGFYFDTVPSSEGCDSILKISVSVASYDTVLTVEGCGSYTAPWGQVYTASTVVDTLIVHGSCVYHNTIDITIHPTYSGIDTTVSAGCYYTWEGQTISDMLPHTLTLKTVEHQCDSIVTLTITSLSGEQFDTVKVAACDKYNLQWQSNPVTESDLYTTDSIININGSSCTKHYTVDLTIVTSNNDTANTAINEISAGCFYVWNNDTLTDTNVHYHLYSSEIGGCDSLVAIKLSYTGKNRDTLHVAHCGSSYNWKNTNKQLLGADSKYTYTRDTIASDSVTVDGCTHVYVLDLKFTNNVDTVYKYYCGESYTHSFKKLNANGTTSNASTTFTHSGYYAVSTEGDTLYDVNGSTGCKTKRTLNLNLHIPEIRYREDTTVAVACERYRFKADNMNGMWITYTQSGEYDATHSQRSQNNENQCYDSIAHLSLTINKNTRINSTARECDSYTWQAGDTIIGTYTESGTYRDTLDAPDPETGCLQIATLTLTIFKTPVVDIEGKWMLEPGESTVLTARPQEGSDPISSYRWYIGNSATAVSQDTTLKLENVTTNTDVRLESTASHGTLRCIATNWITVTANLGIDDIEGTTVNIYPNPASRFLNIESANTIRSVEVYTTLGQLIISQQGNGNEMQLNLGNLTDGHYTLRINHTDGSQAVRSFIVNK